MKRKINILKNQKGLSMVEVLIAAAMAVAVSMGVMRIQENATKSNVKIKTDTEFNNLKNMIKTSLSNGGNCTLTAKEAGYTGVDDPLELSAGDTFKLVRNSEANETEDPDVFGDEYNEVGTQLEINLTDDGDKPIEGYPSWSMKKIILHKLENGGSADEYGQVKGTCKYEFQLQRVANIDSKRSYGASDKNFYVNTTCRQSVNGTDTVISYCISDEAQVLGYFRPVEPSEPDKGIQYQYDVFIGGDLTVSQNILSQSDRNLKKGELVISNASEALAEIPGYTYIFRHDEYPNKNFPEGRQYGIMAQDVERYFPEVVKTLKDGTKAVDYKSLIPILIQAHREQEEKIQAQNKRINELEKKFELLLDK